MKTVILILKTIWHKQRVHHEKAQLMIAERYFFVELQDGVLVVRNVPAPICNQYGEKFPSDDVMEVLEYIASD